MSDPERKIWIVFNGEIYNFRELRSELEGFGHVFRTRSDTEAIIHGYEQWGDEVFNHLNGMFGLAIWDEEKRKLIIARDPMGIKFVYYKVENERLYFGLKCIDNTTPPPGSGFNRCCWACYRPFPWPWKARRIPRH